MRDLAIVADSTCDLEPSLLQGHALTVLPLTIAIGDTEYLDGETIGVTEIYDCMRKGVVPKTAQIPYERTYALFRALLEQGRDVIFISFSSEMSGGFQMATIIARELQEQYPQRRIAILDSRGGSGATGIIVLQALKMAQKGCSFEAIVAEIAFMAAHIEHVFTLDDLEWLAKGGRIPKLVGLIGNRLGFHPILDVQEGRMAVCRMVRGTTHAIRNVADEIILRAKKFPAQLVAICHADNLPAARMVETLVKEALPGCVTMLCHIGGGLAVHLGLKGIGAFCLSQKPQQYCLV